MKNRRHFLVGAAAVAVIFSTTAHSNWWPFGKKKEEAPAGEMVEVTWDDLIPNDFVQPENPFMTMSEEEANKLMDGSDESNAEIARLEAEMLYAPVVPALDGMRVKIPAYITPLEFGDTSLIKEFLLVPYVGACMHTPPPPANQIVHAISEDDVEFPGMREPVWAIGIIRTETVKSDLAESGYRMDIERVLPYTTQ